MRPHGAALRLFRMWLIVPILLTLHIIICLLLVLVILMQLPRSEGLGAAFGGAVTENIFGAQTTHVLARFTVWLGVAFFAITLLLAISYGQRDRGRTPVQRELLNASASSQPASTAAASASSAATPAAAETHAQPSPEPTASPSSTAAPTTP
jgi:preprotein translocase subunit SecG